MKKFSVTQQEEKYDISAFQGLTKTKYYIYP